jgi:hypothetical protein
MEWKIMKILPVVTSCILLSTVSSFSLAAGGQNQIQNPIFGEDCIETIPPGIDDGACEEMPAPAQSGVSVWFCDTTVVIICPEEEE